MYCVIKSETSTDPKSYPCTRAYPSDSACQFQPSWLKQYPWLLYSHNVDGAYCRACVFFAPAIVGGNEPGQFVSKGFRHWVKISDNTAKVNITWLQWLKW